MHKYIKSIIAFNFFLEKVFILGGYNIVLASHLIDTIKLYAKYS